MRPQRDMGLKRDADGHLADPSAWSEAVAGELAGTVGIALGPRHWRVICALRKFHAATGVAPSMRPLVRLLREGGEAELASSVALLRLFPSPPGSPASPATLAAKIAGLPRPDKCL